jgi:transposase
MTDLKTVYQTDYAAWARRHVELLRAGRFAEMDIEHLQEELSDMSKSDRRELESRLLILIADLLKWEYQYQALSERWREFKGDSWRTTIVEQRKQLAVLLRQSPGLKSVLAETILAVYPDAVDLASKETRLPPETFPTQCPYTAEQLLEDEFYPSVPAPRDDHE